MNGAPASVRDVTFTVNGSTRTERVEARVLLVHLLRERLGLTGTHVGCDTSQCGACTVLLDDVAVKSCTVLAVQVDGQRITTIEGFAGPDGGLHPIQEAFREAHALQCGYCTPGMVLAVAQLLCDVPVPTAEDVRHAIKGNLCRCTGYTSIVEAALAAAALHALHASAPATTGAPIPEGR